MAFVHLTFHGYAFQQFNLPFKGFKKLYTNGLNISIEMSSIFCGVRI